MRDAYEDEFKWDSSDDDDDLWIGMEFENHLMGIPRIEEKEMKKELGQESLKEPLDTPNLPLECAHEVEEENPLLNIRLHMSFASEKCCYPVCEEKHVIHNNDVVYVEEADSEMNEEEDVIELFLGSMDDVCRDLDKDSNQEEFSEIRFIEEYFLKNISVQEDFPLERSIQEELQPNHVAELIHELGKQMLKLENQWEEFSAQAGLFKRNMEEEDKSPLLWTKPCFLQIIVMVTFQMMKKH